MGVEILGLTVMAALIAGPLLLERYLRQLPVAPACPSCHAVARETTARWPIFGSLSALGRTFLAECARCGWRGRMRWRWAPMMARDGGRE